MEKLNFLCGNDNLTDYFSIFSFEENNVSCKENCVDGIFCWRSGRCSPECGAVLFLITIIDKIKKDISYEQKKSFFVISC